MVVGLGKAAVKEAFTSRATNAVFVDTQDLTSDQVGLLQATVFRETVNARLGGGRTPRPIYFLR